MLSLIDCHVHLRQDPMSKVVIPYTARCCDQAIAMPNLNPPIHSVQDVINMKTYYQSIAGPGCKIHMTAKLLPRTTIAHVETLSNYVLGYKLYPAGATSNSDDGIPSSWLNNPPIPFLNVIAKMEELDLALLHHGEHPETFCMDRETIYLKFMDLLRKLFPRLRMTLEHITTIDGINWIINNDHVLGTITLHHLLCTLDDLIGTKLKSHLFCKPIYKRPADREALFNAIHKDKFALGSDSAPWYYTDKYCKEGCAGVFSAPVLAEKLLELNKYLDHFVAINAATFYRLSIPTNILLFDPIEWTVPEEINGIVPFLAGEIVKYKLVRKQSIGHLGG